MHTICYLLIHIKIHGLQAVNLMVFIVKRDHLSLHSSNHLVVPEPSFFLFQDMSIEICNRGILQSALEFIRLAETISIDTKGNGPFS